MAAKLSRLRAAAAPGFPAPSRATASIIRFSRPGIREPKVGRSKKGRCRRRAQRPQEPVGVKRAQRVRHSRGERVFMRDLEPRRPQRVLNHKDLRVLDSRRGPADAPERSKSARSTSAVGFGVVSSRSPRKTEFAPARTERLLFIGQRQPPSLSRTNACGPGCARLRHPYEVDRIFRRRSRAEYHPPPRAC